jgi:hypothetical protein
MKKNLITEGVSDQYSRMVKMNVYAHNVKYKGFEINDIIANTMNLNFEIEIEAREWGIKDISVYAIRGENEMELEVSYYSDEANNNVETDDITIPINWDILDTDSDTGEGVVTINDELDVELGNDENGNIIIKGLSIQVYTV